MAIYSTTIDRFAGPKSDTPWKPSPAMKMRQAAAADRVQIAAKQDALDLQNNAANAELRRQVEAATLRQQLASFYNPPASLPNRQGVAAALPSPTTLGLSGNAFASNLPARAGLASRNVLNSAPTGGGTAGFPKPPTGSVLRGRGGSGGGGGGGGGGVGGRSGEFGKPMTDQLGPKYGAATGANPGYVESGAAASAALRANQPGRSVRDLGYGGAMGAPMPSASSRSGGSNARGASPMMQKPALGGADKVTAPGGVLGQQWAGDLAGGSSSALGGVAGVLGKTSGIGGTTAPNQQRFNVGDASRTQSGAQITRRYNAPEGPKDPRKKKASKGQG
jgi:hypothetical protein